MKNIVLEGARGTGKSSIAQYVRENTTNSTLINFTGFNERGTLGLKMIVDYYTAWFGFFRGLRDTEDDMTFIHDRFFFSERVYANLYKDYANDFNYYYTSFLNLSASTFDLLDVYFLDPTSELRLEANLNRGKAILFDDIEESVKNSLMQSEEYKRMFSEIANLDRPKIRLTIIDTSNRSIPDIGDEIIYLSGIKKLQKL